ncbi:uncharacterized protein [Leptinotarsa decemlineata]|uniref:uncharacterized protein n=1 Tax=Leptinotarsa decemlineata TaxID=7539 RepID=UPI003D307525
MKMIYRRTEKQCDQKFIETIFIPKCSLFRQAVQKDFKCLEFMFKCGKYFGTTPFKLKETVSKSISSGIISSILLSLYMVNIYYSTHQKIIYHTNGHKVIEGVSYIISVAQSVFVINSIFILTFRREKSWRYLFENILALERMITKFLDDFSKPSMLYFGLGLMYFLLVFIFISKLYFIFTSPIQLKSILVFDVMITAFYIILFNSYYVILANWMRNRIDHINRILKNSSKNERMTVSGINKITIYYKLVHTIVHQVNLIFGSTMFINICNTVLYILFFFLYAIDGGHIAADRKILNYLHSVTYVVSEISNLLLLECGNKFVSLVILVMACESVEQSGKRIVKTCYSIHESVENTLVRQQLELLVQYAEQWKPRFSAGGFYDINQSCLSSIFSAIITYLVIIIQFNMVLVDEKDEPPTEKNVTLKTW